MERTIRDGAYDVCAAKMIFHDEAEVQTLATLLMSRDVAREAIERGIELGDGSVLPLTPSFFFNPERRLLFEAIAECADNGNIDFSPVELLSRSMRIARANKNDFQGVAQVSMETLRALRDLRPDGGQFTQSVETLRRYDESRAAIEFAISFLNDIGPEKDPRELFAQGQDALQKRMPVAQSDRFSYGYERMEKYNKVLEKRAELYAQGKIVDVGYPWPSWRNLFINHRPGKLFTLLVPQNNGKTTIMQSWAEYLAFNGMHIVYVHLEDTDNDLTDRQLCRWARVPFGIITSGNYPPEVKAKMDEAKAMIAQRFFPRMHHLNGAELTMSGMIRHLNIMIGKLPIGAVFVDYMNAIGTEYSRNHYSNEQSASSVNALVSWSNRNNIPVIVCDQLNKAGEQQVLGGSKITTTFQYGAVQKSNASKTILTGMRPMATKPDGISWNYHGEAIKVANKDEMSPIMLYSTAKVNDGRHGSFTQAIHGKYYMVMETDEYMEALRNSMLKQPVSGDVTLN